MRPAAPLKVKRPSFPMVAEARFAAGYLRFWRVLDKLVRRNVLPLFAAPARERRDAPLTPAQIQAHAMAALDRVRIEFAAQVDNGAIARLCATVGGAIDAHNHLEQSGMGRVIGVDIVRTDKHLQRELFKWTDTNTALIKRTGGLVDQSCREIGDVVLEGFTKGTRHETIAKEIEARLGVAESRALLIARDQTNKLNGALTADRQRDAGVTHYIWSSSRDERVRPTHRELEGQVIAWADPPPEGHPGWPIRCRCVAVPTIVDAKGERRGPVISGAPLGVAGSATLPAPSVFAANKAPATATVAQAVAAVAPVAPVKPTLSTLSLSGSTPAERKAFFEAEADEFYKVLKSTDVASAFDEFVKAAGGQGFDAAQLERAITATDKAKGAAALLRQNLRTMISRDAVDRYGLKRLADTRTVRAQFVQRRAHYAAKAFPGGAATDVLNIGDASPGTMLHEAGHWLETRSAASLADVAPDQNGAPFAPRGTRSTIIRDACTDFRDRNATSQTPVSLRTLTGNSAFAANEVAKPDKFAHAYVGKVYASGDTEVFSMGIERFATTNQARVFVNLHKEHSGLILAILRGRVIP